MSRKTEPRRSTPSRRASSQRHWNVNDVPRVEKPLPLVCGACGALGRYNVGTVTLDPTVAKSPDRDAIEKAVGFTGYFRCRKCDAGGPWELPPETVVYLTALALTALSGIEDVPLVLGCSATFDKQIFRYATDGEAHLKGLIDHEPERAFLWVRLGNLYSHAGQNERAETAYERAIELDPKDIEAHSMLGQVLIETGRPLEAVPNWHAVLKHVRDARQVNKELRRNLVRGAIECLLAAHAESNGQIDLLPTMDPSEMEKARGDEPAVLELREFDLGSEEGINDLCAMFLERPRRSGRGLFPRRKKRVPDATGKAACCPDDWPATPIHRETPTVGRNDRCPCGSGRKYKKCCGR
jgi:tetratricopeptide (TPR) repeat protein